MAIFLLINFILIMIWNKDNNISLFLIFFFHKRISLLIYFVLIMIWTWVTIFLRWYFSNLILIVFNMFYIVFQWFSGVFGGFRWFMLPFCRVLVSFGGVRYCWCLFCWGLVFFWRGLVFFGGSPVFLATVLCWVHASLYESFPFFFFFFWPQLCEICQKW